MHRLMYSYMFALRVFRPVPAFSCIPEYGTLMRYQKNGKLEHAIYELDQMLMYLHHAPSSVMFQARWLAARLNQGKISLQ